MPRTPSATFTRTFLDNAKAGGRPLTLTDKRMPGFQCIVGERRKTFYYVGYKAGRAVRVKIGHFPSLSVDEAREKAQALKRRIDAGDDPKRHKGKSLADVLDAYIEKKEGRGRMREATAKEYRRLLNTTCKAWAFRDAEDISSDEVERFTDTLNRKGQAATANHVLTLIGICRKHLRLPAFVISRYEVKRRELGFTDWSAWYAAVTAQPMTIRNLHLFGVYTGVRREFCLTLRWDMVDMEKKTMKFPEMKHQREVTLPLGDRVVAILREQQGQDEEWVFPSNKAGHIVETRFEGRLGTFHDLRRMFTVAARRCRLPPYAVDMLRADALKNMADHYDVEAAPHEWANEVATELDRRFNLA